MQIYHKQLEPFKESLEYRSPWAALNCLASMWDLWGNCLVSQMGRLAADPLGPESCSEGLRGYEQF